LRSLGGLARQLDGRRFGLPQPLAPEALAFRAGHRLIALRVSRQGALLFRLSQSASMRRNRSWVECLLPVAVMVRPARSSRCDAGALAVMMRAVAGVLSSPWLAGADAVAVRLIIPQSKK
jgi:hypothetical protein